MTIAIAACALPVAADDLREMLFVAIGTGQHTGVLEGPLAAQVSKVTGSRDSIQATVTAVGDFIRPDCKRLRVALRQSGVPTRQGPMAVLELPPFELNMCLNGQPPSETLDPAHQAQRADDLRQMFGQMGAGKSPRP